MVASPKPATAPSSLRPARWRSGENVSQTAIAAVPTAGAARMRPRPVGPTSRNAFEANTGSSATAPPNSTANKSSESAASTIWFEKMNLAPLRMLSRRLSFSPSRGGSARPAMLRKSSSAAPSSTASVP